MKTLNGREPQELTMRPTYPSPLLRYKGISLPEPVIYLSGVPVIFTWNKTEPVMKVPLLLQSLSQLSEDVTIVISFLLSPLVYFHPWLANGVDFYRGSYPTPPPQMDPPLEKLRLRFFLLTTGSELFLSQDSLDQTRNTRVKIFFFCC